MHILVHCISVMSDVFGTFQKIQLTSFAQLMLLKPDPLMLMMSCVVPWSGVMWYTVGLAQEIKLK